MKGRGGMEDQQRDDPRFIIAKHEALMGIALVIFNFLWWFGFAYGLGSKPVSEYSYILGLPSWFFYSCVVGLFVVIGLVFIMVKFFLKDVDFDGEHEG